MPHSEIRQILLEIARERGCTKSFCPSEAARRFAAKISQPGNWRDWMEAVRTDARQLEEQGKLEFLQRGKRISCKPGDFKGPIRLRLLNGAEEEADHVKEQWSRKTD